MTEDELLANVTWVQGLARRLLRDASLAEDVAQDVLAVAWEARGREVQPGRLRAWLNSVTRNLAYQALRREGAREGVELEAARSEATEDSTARAELQHSLTAAVLALDEKHRTVVVMRYFDELPPRVIAKRLGLPGTTVRKRLSRAIAQVHRTVERDPEFDAERWHARLVVAARLDAPSGGWSSAAKLATLAAAGLALWLGAASLSDRDAETETPGLTVAPERHRVRVVSARGPMAEGEVVRVNERGVESFGRTSLDGIVEVDGALDDLFLIARQSPPLRVQVGADGAGDEDGIRVGRVRAGNLFGGVALVEGYPTTEPLTFRVHIDARDTGVGSLPRALLDSDYVELTPEGDFVLEATSGVRGAFFFWGIPADTEVFLTPPDNMCFVEGFHPPGVLYPDGVALELIPPTTLGYFGVASVDAAGDVE